MSHPVRDVDGVPGGQSARGGRVPEEPAAPAPMSFVLIHGMDVTASAWDPWVERLTALGHDARAIEWPGYDLSPAELRGHPPEDLPSLTFGKLVEHCEEQLRFVGLEDAVLIGHSMGGLVVQALLARGIGAAGIVISPAPPSGVVSLDPRFLRANLTHLNVLARSRPAHLSPQRFHTYFANRMTREQSDALWAAHCVPTARSVPLGSLGEQGVVDPAALTRPLLVYGGADDRIIPAALARRIANRYPTAEYRELPDADHAVCFAPGWESLADACVAWAAERVVRD